MRVIGRYIEELVRQLIEIVHAGFILCSLSGGRGGRSVLGILSRRRVLGLKRVREEMEGEDDRALTTCEDDRVRPLLAIVGCARGT